jgi:hypothetical protein
MRYCTSRSVRVFRQLKPRARRRRQRDERQRLTQRAVTPAGGGTSFSRGPAAEFERGATAAAMAGRDRRRDGGGDRRHRLPRRRVA